MDKLKLETTLEEKFGITDISVLPEKAQRKFKRYKQLCGEKRAAFIDYTIDPPTLRPRYKVELKDLQEDIIEEAAIFLATNNKQSDDNTQQNQPNDDTQQSQSNDNTQQNQPNDDTQQSQSDNKEDKKSGGFLDLFSW